MLLELFRTGIFRLCHGNQLVYNTCWEDPRLDRVALQIGPTDRVMVITSGGCNVLDYLLDNPRHVHAVDINWRQNALLELKIAAIRTLDFDTFFSLFGEGRCASWDEVYAAHLREQLTERARKFWDDRGWMFRTSRGRSSFYFCGSSGFFAWLINVYVDRIARFRGDVEAILNCDDLERQRDLYLTRIKPQLWGPAIRWLTRRDIALALLGVPRSQRRQIDSQYPGGIAKYIEDQIDELFTKIPLRDNYFWRVYATGAYSRSCCPEYLKEKNFAALKAGLVDRISTHTTSILDFLRETPHQISRFILLDHMDWLYEKHQDILGEQWQEITRKASPGARVIWRSAALNVDFVDPLIVQHDGKDVELGTLLRYDQELANSLHTQDRVHTYGSFYIAQLDNHSKLTTGPNPGEEETDDERCWNAQDTVPPELVAHSR